MNWTHVSAAVEGVVDEAVAQRIAAEKHIELTRVFGKQGKTKIVNSLHGYNRAAAQSPWWVLVDLDQDALCAPTHVAELLPNPSRHMKLRVACRAIESWLLADRPNLASFLRVRTSSITAAPDELPNPKAYLVDLARSSTSSAVRQRIVPRPGAGRAVGPGYSGAMIEFVEARWDPRAAAESSDSLRRCWSCISDPT